MTSCQPPPLPKQTTEFHPGHLTSEKQEPGNIYQKIHDWSLRNRYSRIQNYTSLGLATNALGYFPFFFRVRSLLSPERNVLVFWKMTTTEVTGDTFSVP